MGSSSGSSSSLGSFWLCSSHVNSSWSSPPTSTQTGGSSGAFEGVPVDMDVLEDNGEPGTVGVSVVSVTADEEEAVEFDCEDSSCVGRGKSKA